MIFNKNDDYYNLIIHLPDKTRVNKEGGGEYEFAIV